MEEIYRWDIIWGLRRGYGRGYEGEAPMVGS